jgi:hypothetical protein
MHRLYYTCRAALIVIGASILLTACGGGECDKSCDDIAAQADGRMTIEPVHCSASGVCS